MMSRGKDISSVCSSCMERDEDEPPEGNGNQKNEVSKGKEEKSIKRGNNKASNGAAAYHGNAQYAGEDAPEKMVGRDNKEVNIGTLKIGIYFPLDEKLHFLCIPKQIVSEARNQSKDNDIEFLKKLKDLVNEENDKKYCLPSREWKTFIKNSFPQAYDAKMKNVESNFPNNELEQWKHFVLDVLSDGLETLKNSENQRISEEEAGEKYYDGSTKKNVASGSEDSHFKYRKTELMPIDFIETECFQRFTNMQGQYPAIHLYGGNLRGKTYALNRFANSMKDSELNVIWQLCFTKITSLQSKLENLVQDLIEKDILTERDSRKVFSDGNPVLNFVKLLIEKQITALLIFDNPPDKDKILFREAVSYVIGQTSSSEPLVRILMAKNEEDFVFHKEEVKSNLNFRHFEITGFTNTESVNYLTSNRPADLAFYHYIVDDSEGGDVNLYDEEQARELAEFFGNNPGCLELAKRYCITRKLSYKQYLDSMKKNIASDLIGKEEDILAHKSGKDMAMSLRALRQFLRADKEHSTKQFEKLKRILKILTFLNRDDIPIHLIGKICQELRDDQLSPNESFEMNKVEASEMVYRMKELNFLSAEPSINYPNGLISFQDNTFRGLMSSQNEEEKISNMKVALQSLVKMISKDNKERKADIHLCYLIPHIESLKFYVDEYLENHFDCDDNRKEAFVFAMTVSRLYELLGQGIIQERRTDSTVNAGEKASKVLIDAACLMYNVMDAFNQPNFLFRCFFGKNDDDLLAYKETKKPDEEGKKIADDCIAAGKKVASTFIETYLIKSVVLNKDSYRQFLDHTMKTQGLSADEAEKKLKPIATLVEKKVNFDSSHMKVLRETANFLTTEQLCLSFFADRLASIFHTYGRQVLYLQSEMPVKKQKECEYYTLLSHNIAKTIRTKAGIGLLFEYISMANGYLPRLLQNTENEEKVEKLNRINQARDLCTTLLNTSWDHFENGYFQRVQGYPYARLNIMKYLVKANTKTLKYLNKKDLPENSFQQCEETLQLVRENYKLDMAPHIFIQGAKFYAATGRFKEAFSTFSDAFVFKKDGKPTEYGILRLLQRRLRSVAWAVDNFCRAVKAYSNEETDNEKFKEKKERALAHCETVLNEKPGQEWKSKLESWKAEFKD